MPNPAAAANAYAALARLVPTATQSSATDREGSGFASLLQGALDHFIAQGRATDTKTAQLAAGKADLVDVVTAVSESEVALQTVVAVRDKVISAYEEIMRMPI